MTTGLSKTINFFSNALEHFKNNQDDQTLGVRFSRLSTLEYDYIDHVLSFMTDSMYSKIMDRLTSFETTFRSFSTILLICSILAFIYFALYPVSEMEEVIIETKDLINLIPDEEKLNMNNDSKKGEY